MNADGHKILLLQYAVGHHLSHDEHHTLILYH